MDPSTFIEQVALMAQINPVIKQAQEAKRSGNVKKARKILEGCLAEYISAGIPEGHTGFAPLYKSLGKVCHLDKDLRHATIYFLEAAHAYTLAGFEQEATLCLIHLGCCGPFGMTRYYDGYLKSLKGDDSMPLLPQEVVMDLLSMGQAVYAGTYPEEFEEQKEDVLEKDEEDEDDWDENIEDEELDDELDSADWDDEDDADGDRNDRVYTITAVSQLDALINMGTGLIDSKVMSPEMSRALNAYASGTLAMQQGALEEAVNIFRLLLTSAPNFVAPRVNLGNCLIDMNQPAEGLEELKHAIHFAPRDVDVYMSMAKAYAYLLDSDNEIQMYEKIIQIDPHHLLALSNLGATFRDMAQLDASEKWLLKAKGEAESAWGNNEQRIRVYHNLALTYEVKNEIGMALEYWERCSKLEPSNPQFKDSLKRAQEKRKIDDTVKPIYRKDGSVVAPDGYCTTPKMLEDVTSTLQKQAELAVALARERFKCTLDYSEGSLDNLESLFEQAYNHFNQLEKTGKLRIESVQYTANVWGSYLGEMLRRKWGGKWLKKDGETVLALDKMKISPIKYVYQHILRQPEYNVKKYWAEIKATTGR